MTRRLLLAGLLAVFTVACEREERRYQELPAAAARPASTQVSALEPGLPMAEPRVSSPYQENAYGIAEGKRLYSAFNCNGCHAMGGGGIGPALMDDKWIYGSAPDQIYSSISQGRPDGMPTFGSRVPTQQIWQLVAYVQSLSVQVPRDVMSGRSDGLSARQPDLRLDRFNPRWTGHR